MTEPAQDNQPDTRTRLLEAAVHCFAEKGFEGTGIRDIAQRAQANSALVQYHFGGKEGLYLAAMKFLFEQGPDVVRTLPPPPAPGEPKALPRAIESLRNYVRAFLEELFACHGTGQCSRELGAAMQLFWTREMMNPGSERVDLILGHIQPHLDYLYACFKVLRPSLEGEARFLMGASIHAQIVFFHRDMAMIGLLRGAAYGPQDIEALTAHITEFSLRGLGLAGSDPGA